MARRGPRLRGDDGVWGRCRRERAARTGEVRWAWAHDKWHNLYQKACHCERSEAISKGIARPWEIAALPAVARNDSLMGALCRAPILLINRHQLTRDLSPFSFACYQCTASLEVTACAGSGWAASKACRAEASSMTMSRSSTDPSGPVTASIDRPRWVARKA